MTASPGIHPTACFIRTTHCSIRCTARQTGVRTQRTQPSPEHTAQTVPIRALNADFSPQSAGQGRHPTSNKPAKPANFRAFFGTSSRLKNLRPATAGPAPARCSQGPQGRHPCRRHTTNVATRQHQLMLRNSAGPKTQISLITPSLAPKRSASCPRCLSILTNRFDIRTLFRTSQAT
jgi:hypothetical protein